MKTIFRTMSVIAAMLVFCLNMRAENDIDKSLFGEKTELKHKDKGKLTLDIDNLNFFHNNEYWGRRTSGYTLPGFYLKSTIGYQPLKNVKVDAGVYLRHYWGANGYPSYHFRDVLRTVRGNRERAIQARPYIRAQVELSKYVNMVFGNIYGGVNHNLPTPIYSYERELTEYPETGLQLLVKSRYFDMDTWINWESFIFRDDNHQEAFTFGVSTKTKVNRPKSKVHVNFPVSVVFQHRGGEIDTIPDHRVQTWMNLSASVAVDFNFRSKVFRKITVEGTASNYMELEDNLMPFEKGWLFYAKASADIWRFRAGVSYWVANDFISLLGNPYYGAIHVPYDGKRFDSPQVGAINIEYNQNFGKFCNLGIRSDLYFTRDCKAILQNGETFTEKSNIGFAAGAYLRIHPSFVLKKLKKH